MRKKLKNIVKNLINTYNNVKKVKEMLSQFIVKNFRSIKNEIVLDLNPTAISEHKEHLFKNKKGQDILPISILYGPNGAGKSNILRAICALLCIVFNPIKYSITNDFPMFFLNDRKEEIIPFALDNESCNNPTEFVLFLKCEIGEYKYQINIFDNEIIYEKLEILNYLTRRVSKLFIRENNEIKMFNELSKLKVNAEISKTLPLISYLRLTYFENDIVKDLFINGFNTIFYVDYSSSFNYKSDLILNLLIKNEKSKFLQILKKLDTKIDDYRFVDKDNQIELYTKHKIEEEYYELPLEEESTGTKKIFSVISQILLALDLGGTFVADELDAQLHPILLKYLIEMFTNPNINRHCAQLIFTSHDMVTMTNELLRRDEIWFVAKGEKQESILYSLVEFKVDKFSVRKDASYNKQYLEGKYGADPYFIKMTSWEDLDG